MIRAVLLVVSVFVGLLLAGGMALAAELSCAGAPGAACEGTNEDDTFYGSLGRDVMRGYGGADLMVGRDGDDVLVGHEGNDTIYGHGGDDDIYGSYGDDHL